VWAYRRIGGGTRAAPLSDGTYRTYGTKTSPTHRSHESYKSHSVAEPHAYAHPPSPRYAHTPPRRSQDLPISVLRDILGSRGSFNRTVDQNP